MSLKDKINALILGLGFSSTRFADHIGVTRPIISHILTGRNKPSLEIIQKIVSKFPELGYNWIADNEELDMEIVVQLAEKHTLNPMFPSNDSAREFHGSIFAGYNQVLSNSQDLGLENKKISKIVVFYTDNTFSQFSQS